MEARFNANRITSQCSHYCYIVENLLTDVANEVTDLLEMIPEN